MVSKQDDSGSPNGPAIRLKGTDLKELHSALIEAYPTVQALRRMVLHECGKQLNAFTDGSLEDRVFALIENAEARGWIEKLVRGAVAGNSKNAALCAFHERVVGPVEPGPPSRLGIDLEKRRWVSVVVGLLGVGIAGAGIVTVVLREPSSSSGGGETSTASSSGGHETSTSSSSGGHETSTASSSGGHDACKLVKKRLVGLWRNVGGPDFQQFESTGTFQQQTPQKNLIGEWSVSACNDSQADLAFHFNQTVITIPVEVYDTKQFQRTASGRVEYYRLR